MVHKKMWNTGKLFKKVVLPLILFWLGLTVIISRAWMWEVNTLKLKINEDGCRIPYLPIDNPEIMAFYMETEKIDCGNSLDDWVTCEKSICFVKPEVTATKGEVVCSYTDLIRKTDFTSKNGNTTKTKEPYTLQESDFVRVVCNAKNGDRWYGMASGIRNPVHRTVKQTKFPLYNVLMMGFDSLSRNSFIRKLPKSYEFLVKDLQAMVLLGYNIVDKGKPEALIPILTGRTKLELTGPHSVPANTFPLVWKDFERYGYKTSFNEDLPELSTFAYRMEGFGPQPTDHYLRTFYLEVKNITKKRFCIGNQPGHRVMLDYTRNFMNKYSDIPRFIFSFHGELSRHSINNIGSADDDIVDWLINLRDKRLLDDTILILMSDHGNSFSDVRNTLQGIQEERLPFFSFAFPESFKNRYTREFRNFEENINRLTTPFDIHETLIDLLRLQSKEERKITNKPSRGISLFSSIPQNRSCASASIEPHWCACLSWHQLSDTTTIRVKRIAHSVLRRITDATDKFRDLCELFKLKEINWTLQLSPHPGLLEFIDNQNYDGYEEFYQIQITVSPGGCVFKATVSYNHHNLQAVTKLSHISCANKHGSQGNCINDTNSELRKYCYCKEEKTLSSIGAKRSITIRDSNYVTSESDFAIMRIEEVR